MGFGAILSGPGNGYEMLVFWVDVVISFPLYVAEAFVLASGEPRL